MANEGTPRGGLFELVQQIVRSNPAGTTAQEIRYTIKAEYLPLRRGLPPRNVECGNYAELDHALLAQIHIAVAKASGMPTDDRVLSAPAQ